MTEPLFPHKVTSAFWTGIVDRIEDENVGWGSRDDGGGTFDIPLPDGIGIGTRVEFYEAGTNYQFDFIVALLTDQTCWLMSLEDTPNGYEILGASEFPKLH